MYPKVGDLKVDGYFYLVSSDPIIIFSYSLSNFQSLIANDCDHRTIQEILRHRGVRTTLRYGLDLWIKRRPIIPYG